MPTRIAALLSLLFGANGLALAAGGAINGGGPASSLGATVACTNGSSANINSGNLYIDCTNTRVGINTASPGALLDIGAGDVGTTPKNVLLSDRTDTSVGGGVMFRTLTAVRFGGVNDDSGSESFQLRNNSNVVQMYLGIIGARAGRLGLGTSSPATLFHMSSGTLTIDGNVNPAMRVDPQLQVLVSSGNNATPGLAFNGDTGTGIFQTAASRINFVPAGSVNVTTMNSSGQWDFGNSIAMPAGQTFRLSGINSNRNTIGDGLGDRISFNSSGGADRMRIATGGHVLINTTTDSGQLMVVSSQAASEYVLNIASQAAATTMFGVRGSGGVMFTQKTKAQFDTLTPTGVGEIFQCSNCTVTYALCHATGTLVAQWGREGSATVGCGSGE